MITMKAHDTTPDLSVTLTDNGAIVDLTTATTIRVLAAMNGAPVFTRTATGTALGVVTMPWQTTDTAIPGMLELEVEITWPPDAVQTFPASGRLRVNIEPDLDIRTTPPPPGTYGTLTEDPAHPGLYLIGA